MSMRTFIATTAIALACVGCSSSPTETPSDAVSATSSSSAAVPALPTSTVAAPAAPEPPPVPQPQPVTYECGDLDLYQSGTALYSDGTTGYEAECDTFVAPAAPELSYCDYGGTAVFTDGSYAVNDPRCAATAPSPESGYPYDESEDRNGDGVVNGYERCGVLCGEEPTSGDIQTQYGCEQGYITGPQCE